jgi:methyltransferase (TIGR00027 family)
LNVSDDQIQHIIETAPWIAGCRALESSRSDALFHDPFAAALAGERGLRIAKALPDGLWVVGIRTVVIDAFLRSAISAGIEMIVNLGAGLDTRPYRMDLPSSLRWIEVDHPSLIEGKEAQLRNEAPACSVERFGLDLTEHGARQELFDRLGATSTRALALTEGLVSYLSVDEAAALADDLRAQPSFELWVTEYLSPRRLRYYQKHQPNQDVPVRFDPVSCEVFFTQHGWRVQEIRYLGEESKRLLRPVPLPRLAKVMRPLMSQARRQQMLRDMGYAVLERAA